MEQLGNIYEKWMEIPRWQKWILLVLVGAFLFGVLYYFRIEPLKREILAKQRQLDSLALSVSRLKTFEKRREKIKREIENLQGQITAIETKLPSGKEEVSQILRSITNADSGMVISFIKREKPLSKKYYDIFPYTVQLVGTYPNLVHWCEKLSKANRIINFGDISIVEYHNNKKKQPYTIVATLKLKAFTLKR